MAKLNEWFNKIMSRESNSINGGATLGNLVATGQSHHQSGVTIVSSTQSGKPLSTQDIIKNSTVNTCIEFRAKAFAQCPPKIVCTLDDGSKVDACYGKGVSRAEKEAARAVLRLLKTPNKFQSRYEFQHQLAATMQLNGECYTNLWRVPDIKGKTSPITIPSEMFVIEPSSMSTIITDKRYPEYRFNGASKSWYDINSVSQYRPSDAQIFQYWEIIHNMEQGYHGASGWNKTTLAAELIRLDQDIDVYANFVMTNGTKLSGVFSFSGNLTSDKKEALAHKIKESFAKMSQYNGSNDAGSAIILESGATYTQIEPLKLTDADLINLKKFTTTRICALFGIAPAMIGLAEATYNNTTALITEHYKSTLYPFMVNVQEKFTASLLGQFPRLHIEFDTDELLKGSLKEQADIAIALKREGIWTVNQALEFIGSPTSDDPSANSINTAPAKAAVTGGDIAPSPQDTGGGGGPQGPTAAAGNGGQNK